MTVKIGLTESGLSKEVLTAAIIMHTALYADALGSRNAMNIGIVAVADYLVSAKLTVEQTGKITDLVSALTIVGTTLGITQPEDVAEMLKEMYSDVND